MDDTDLSDDPTLSAFLVEDPSKEIFKKIIVRASNTKEMVMENIHGAWKLSEFIRNLRDRESFFMDKQKISFILSSRVIAEEDYADKTLIELDFRENSVVTVLWKVVGGSGSTEGNKKRYYPKDTTTWVRKIKPSEGSCDISLEDPEEGFYHAEIPCCGTVISAETAYYQLKKEIFDNKCAEFKCRFSYDCKRPISFGYFSWLAQLDDTEKQTFQKEMENCTFTTTNSELQRCPNEKCGAYMEKPDNLSIRVICPVCQEYEWCWICRNKWQGQSNSKCGNPKCGTSTIDNVDLSKCELATISGIKNVPTLRLCPKSRCRTLIKWTENCKHVVCPTCGHEFCMSCLKHWKSNHLSQMCTVVPN